MISTEISQACLEEGITTGEIGVPRFVFVNDDANLLSEK